MTTAHATSEDGGRRDWHGTVLAPKPGTWDARGARLIAILPDGRATYDGQATKDEEWPLPGESHELRTELIPA